jgi:hypothetical protein
MRDIFVPGFPMSIDEAASTRQVDAVAITIVPDCRIWSKRPDECHRDGPLVGDGKGHESIWLIIRQNPNTRVTAKVPQAAQFVA